MAGDAFVSYQVFVGIFETVCLKMQKCHGLEYCNTLLAWKNNIIHFFYDYSVTRSLADMVNQSQNVVGKYIIPCLMMRSEKMGYCVTIYLQIMIP